jgi:4-hydroxy-tetrahydrodipicolinate reductase
MMNQSLNMDHSSIPLEKQVASPPLPGMTVAIPPTVCLGHVGIIGLSGRMGQRIVSALEKQGGFRSILGYDRAVISDKSWKNIVFCASLDELFEQSSVVIDFSVPELFPHILDAAWKNPKPMVIGTTGIEPDVLRLIDAIGHGMAIVVAPNTSLGAIIQRWLAGKLNQFLPNSYDIDIVEHHHRYKKDIPSGTANALADALIAAKKDQGLDIRAGQTTSPRQDGRIEMHGLRCGHVFGMHEVIWTGTDDRLVLGHTVFSPHIFADGAIALARWVMNGQKPGVYGAEDALGLTNLSCPG